MKAWQLEDTKGIDSYVLNDVPEPEPGPGEVRVDLKYSGLNHLDIWTAMGLPAPKHLPHTTGADGAGIVDAVGEGVSGHEVGDEVVIDPSYLAISRKHVIIEPVSENAVLLTDISSHGTFITPKHI